MTMPMYEYQCEDCSHMYMIKATFEEKTAGLKAACPKCGSSKAKQLIGGYILLQSGQAKRAGRGPCCDPSSGCCPPR